MTRPENVEQTGRRQTTNGDADSKTVTMRIGAPEHSRARGEQADRQPAGGRAHGSSPGVGSPFADGATSQVPDGAIQDQSRQGAGPDFSSPTVRVGGYTPPTRVPPASVPHTRDAPGRVPRRTSLQLQRLEPWSVLKLSLVLSVAGFLVWMVAVGVLYGILGGMGVWDEINGTYSDLTSVNNPQAGTALVSGGRVFGVSLVIGLVNIVLMTALATVGSMVYNIGADLVGGVEVTLSEPE